MLIVLLKYAYLLNAVIREINNFYITLMFFCFTLPYFTTSFSYF